MKDKATSSKIKRLKSRGQKEFLEPTEEAQMKIINGHELKFTNLSKIYWPKEGYTKRDFPNNYKATCNSYFKHH